MRIKDIEFVLHKEEGDHYEEYKYSDSDETDSNDMFFGYVDINGRWIIARHTYNAGIRTRRFSYGFNGYTTAWGDKESLDYYYYYELRAIAKG